MSWVISSMDNEIDELEGTSIQKLFALDFAFSFKSFAILSATIYMAKYLEDDIQHILKLVPKVRTFKPLTLH